jgi:hypothetical protein
VGNFGLGEQVRKLAIGQYDDPTVRAHMLRQAKQNELRSSWGAALVDEQEWHLGGIDLPECRNLVIDASQHGIQ